MFLKAKQGGEINKTCRHNLMQHKNNWVFIHHFLKKCLTFFVFILDRNETTQQKTKSGYCVCSQCASIFTLAPVVFVLRHECGQYLHTQGWYTFTYNILFKRYRLSDWLHVEQLRFAPPAPTPPPQSPPPTYLQSICARILESHVSGVIVSHQSIRDPFARYNSLSRTVGEINIWNWKEAVGSSWSRWRRSSNQSVCGNCRRHSGNQSL